MSSQRIFDLRVRAYFKNKYGGGGEADHSMEDGLISGTITEYRNDRVESVASDMFMNRVKLTRVTLPNVKTVGKTAFYGCDNLKVIELGNVTDLGERIIQNSGVEYLIFRCEAVCCDTGAFQNTHAFNLLVPRALQDAFIDAFDPRDNPQVTVLALEDYTVDGTVTGELDLTKMGL